MKSTKTIILALAIAIFSSNQSSASEAENFMSKKDYAKFEIKLQKNCSNLANEKLQDCISKVIYNEKYVDMVRKSILADSASKIIRYDIKYLDRYATALSVQNLNNKLSNSDFYQLLNSWNGNSQITIIDEATAEISMGFFYEDKYYSQKVTVKNNEGKLSYTGKDIFGRKF